MGKNDLTLIFILNTIFDTFIGLVFLSVLGVALSQFILTISDIIYFKYIEECVNDTIIGLYVPTMIIGLIIFNGLTINILEYYKNLKIWNTTLIFIFILYTIKIILILVMTGLLKLEDSGDCNRENYDYLKIFTKCNYCFCNVIMGFYLCM